jgi:3-phosphoshikimate 1-carboxyvinyltransferase
MQYPRQIEIRPLANPPCASVRVPGSKSITNRALVLGALTAVGEKTTLIGALKSEDTELMVAALQKLGFRVQANWDADPPTVDVGPLPQSGPGCPPYPADLFVGNSGTTMRFLIALVTIGQGRFRLHGVSRMHERPIGDLLEALAQVGIRAFSERGNQCPPVIIEGGPWKGDHIRIRGDVSSQFASALLLVAPLACHEDWFTIEVPGTVVSRPYVDMTAAMVAAWGLPLFAEGTTGFKTHHAGANGYLPGLLEYQIEPDASAASYFFGAAAIAGGSVGVHGLPEKSLQGDVRFVDVLETMGCRIERTDGALTVHGGPLHGIDIDMNDISDTVMTLGAVACFADGPTTIRNVAHIRHKETDRLQALATELRRVGARVDEFADGLTITPGPLHGAVVQTYKDHRMAMSLALIGLKIPGIVIDEPACVAKTYPHFFDDLERLR